MTRHLRHMPIIKWAGGKTKLMPFISHHYPHDHSCRWVEPFIGGGAVFLNMFAQNALLADSNPDLINLYRTIQRQKTNFINQVQNLADKTFVEKDYYEMRDRFNKTCISGQSLQRAALFYSLNRLGYNGMCRYNSERIYSVPWGKHTELKLDLNKIDYLSFRLSGIELITAGFEETLAATGEGDQIYCDPPYDKTSKTSFVSYDGKPFIDRNLNPQKTKKAPQNGCFFNTPCAPYERKRLLNRMTLIDTGYEWRFFAPFPVKWTQLPLCGSQPHTCCRASRSCIRTSSASR